MNGLSLYLRYAKMNFKSIIQYKLWKILMLSVAVNTIVDFLAVVILFSRFGSLGDWSIYHILLIFGIATTSFGLAEWLSRGYDVFPNLVNTGFLDRMLLRPRTTFLQVMGHRFEFQRLGRVLVGIGCISIAHVKLGLGLDILKFLALIGALLGGWLVYTGIFMNLSTLSFWTLQPLDISYIFTNATLQYAQIPLPLLGQKIKGLLTFVLPLGLCYYYPAMYIADLSHYPIWVSFMALPGGIIFFLISLKLWIIGVKHYHSSGT